MFGAFHFGKAIMFMANYCVQNHGEFNNYEIGKSMRIIKRCLSF